VRYIWVILFAPLAWVAQDLVGAMLGREIRGWLDRVPVMLVRLAAQRLPVEARAGYAEEWSGELAAIGKEFQDLPVTRRVRQAWFALGMLRAAGAIGRVVADEDGVLVAGVERGVIDASVLTRRFLELAGPERHTHWPRTMSALLDIAVDRLSTGHAADVAQCISDAGRPDLALWWAQHWLRPERIRGRHPEDAVAMFRRLRQAWRGEPAELRDAFLRLTDHWSWASRQQVEQMLDAEP
jgi:hypothetical protein